jgi:hypothetical protein
LTDEQRRASSHGAQPNGCTEAIMLSHGFDLVMLGKLALDGYCWD